MSWREGEPINFRLPRILSQTDQYAFSDGDLMSEAAADCGLIYDPWQDYIGFEALKVKASGSMVYPEVGIVIPRQNGKNKWLEGLELYWMFITKEPLIVHSAHKFSACAMHFKRLRSLIKSNDEWYACTTFSGTHGQERIKIYDTPAKRGEPRELQFISRKGEGSARGDSATKVVLDEAYNVTEEAQASILPTIAAAPPGFQIVYTSTPVNQEIHNYGTFLAKVRHDGLNKKPGLLYVEYSSKEGCPHNFSPEDLVPCLACLGDRARWAEANPGYPQRNTDEALDLLYHRLPPKQFAVEHLGIGDWPSLDGEGSVIDMGVWADLLDGPNPPRTYGSRISGKRVFAVHSSDFGRRTSIAVAGRRSDGKYHVEVVENRPGMSWAPTRLAELQKTWEPEAIAFVPNSPTGGIEAELIKHGVDTFPLNTTQVVQAFSTFYNQVMHQRAVRHIGQRSLDSALKSAVVKTSGEGSVWDARKSEEDISALQAVCYALSTYMILTADDWDDVEGLVW